MCLPFVRPNIDDLLQRLDQERAPLGRYRRGDHQHAVFVAPTQTAPLLAADPFPVVPVDPFVGSDKALQLRRATAPGDRQQRRLGLPRGHPGDGAHLRVAQDPVAERRVDARQPVERPTDADALPGGAGPEPAAVVEPVAEIAVTPFGPAAPAVHRGDELDEAPVGEVDVGGHVRDCATQFGGVVGDEIEFGGFF